MSLNLTPSALTLVPSQPQAAFEPYLCAALDTALTDEAAGKDGGEFAGIRARCRQGVVANWSGLTPVSFLQGYLWCVGSSQKNFDKRCSVWDDQLSLLRHGDPERIARERDDIREERLSRPCYLHPKVVESVIEAATKIFVSDWQSFRRRWLLLPEYPDSVEQVEWLEAYWLLRNFPQVADAIAWYLVRNLYGGSFLKPDIHIKKIAEHFFGQYVDPLAAMSAEAHRVWPHVCADPRLLPAHLGEIDYVLWWHGRKNGLPESKA
ncbi:MAG: hypothetical protein ACRELG_22605 [Gemmataceae bacterium]